MKPVTSASSGEPTTDSADQEERDGTLKSPPFAAYQKRLLEQRWQKISRGTTDEMAMRADCFLLRVESLQASSHSLQKRVGGKMKRCIFILRELARALSNRASADGDSAYWKEKAKRMEEEVAKLRAKQEPLNRRILRLQKENRELQVRMQVVEEELGPSATLRRRCAFPVRPPVDREKMEVDVETTGGIVAGGHTRARLDLPPQQGNSITGNMWLESSLMGIGETLRVIMDRLEILESRFPDPLGIGIPPFPPNLSCLPRRRQRRGTIGGGARVKKGDGR
jgi:hypothetical protein